MNVPPASGLAGSAAGAPLSQTKGAETERAARATADQARQADSQDRSVKAAGIGQMEQDAETSDRDADGRRLWEDMGEKQDPELTDEMQAPSAARHRAKDPTGESGNSLDLMG